MQFHGSKFNASTLENSDCASEPGASINVAECRTYAGVTCPRCESRTLDPEQAASLDKEKRFTQRARSFDRSRNLLIIRMITETNEDSRRYPPNEALHFGGNAGQSGKV